MMVYGSTRLLRLALAAAALIAGGCQARSATAGSELQRALDVLAQNGGGTHRLPAETTVAVQRGVVVPQGVVLDLNGGHLVATLSDPADAGVRLLSNSGVINGRITVRSRGVPGTQGGAHAPILIGTLYGEDPLPSRRSPFADPAGWRVSGVTLSSDKVVPAGGGVVAGSPAIQVMGGAKNGIIEDVTVPDSSRMAGGIHLDWGTVGPIRSADITGSDRAFQAGRGWTTHPHDIVIRRIRIGRLSRPSIAASGSFGIRLSGVHEIAVSDVSIDGVTEAAIYHTAGDLGYAFARQADRARALQGTRITNVRVASADGAYLVQSDSFADNIARAAEQGYRPRSAPLAATNLFIADVSGTAGRSRPPNYGVRVNHQRGGTLADIVATGFRRGFYIDEQVYGLSLVRPVANDSIEAALSVEHPYRPPSDVAIVDPRVGGRRGAAGSATLIIGRSDQVKVTGGNARVRLRPNASRPSIAAGLQVERE